MGIHVLPRVKLKNNVPQEGERLGVSEMEFGVPSETSKASIQKLKLEIWSSERTEVESVEDMLQD